MRLIWLAPIAWAGLVTLVVPVVIHLLTRQHTRVWPFPTLRFVRVTRLSAMRRRVVQDWWLLALRLSILVLAVAALAGPVAVSGERAREWGQRVARAIVVAPASGDATLQSIVDDEQRSVFAASVFTPRTRLADGLRDAAMWLTAQSAGRHEIVVVGRLTERSLAPADLALAPGHIALRFLPLPVTAAGDDADVAFVEGGRSWRARVVRGPASTRTSYEPASPHAVPITLRAASSDIATVQSGFDAMLARGISVPRDSERQIIVVFEGASTEGLAAPTPPRAPWMRETLAGLGGLRGGASGDVLVIFAPRAGTSVEAARMLDRIARAAFTHDPGGEHTPVTPQTLAEWSRALQPLNEYPVQDEGDRRWVWGAVLALLLIEGLARRRAPANDAAVAAETRVA